MSYDIHITRTAEEDLSEAVSYIDNVLLNPEASDALLNALDIQAADLADSPEKYMLVDDPVLHSWGVRFTLVKNYLAFYVIEEESKTVHIIRFLYGKRDWITILRHGFSLD
ncbi:MAG: type II toxin-antitoxin system RelE/ParE family toxin [Oscillospiraceae bacterium]|nr:type II toxin-antitoxin system RelE/ParE family toxin [Oscillospiraceae bacterium]